MSKLSWWIIGTAATMFALYLCVFLFTALSIASPGSASLNPLGQFILAREHDVIDLFLPRSGIIISRSNPVLEPAHAIGLALYSYANDNGQKYPTGKSSTEVFQKLIDGGYVTDPRLFYVEELHIPGKHPAASNKLKPENVCWDVTVPSDLKSDESLPLLFITGFKVTYVPGGSAVPRPTPTASSVIHAGIYVYYVNNSAMFRPNDGKPDEVVPNFVSPSFKPGGITYIQLSPDGPVP